MRTYAQLTTSFVVFCNRVGVDESISFWGGSEVIAPTGRGVFSAPLYDEGLFTVDIDLADVRRERIALPLLRDERPELVVREWRRLIAERAGLAPTSTAEPGADRAWTSRRGGAPRQTARMAAGDATRPRPTDGHRAEPPCSTCRPSSPSTPTSPAGSSPSSSAASSSQAGFERTCSGLSGGIDSALVAYLVAEAIGADRLLCRADALPDLVAGLARRRRGGRRPSGLRVELVDISADGRRLLRRRRSGRARRRCAAATSWPAMRMAVAVRPVGDLGWARRRAPATRPSRSSATRRCSATPRARSTRSATCTRARSASWRSRRRARGDHPQGAVGRPVARPDRRERGRVHLPRARPAPVLADRQAALGRRGRRPRLRPRRSSGSTGWSPAPSSSARCRRSPSSGRGRPASTTSTRAGGRARRGRDGERPGRLGRAWRHAVRRRDADREPRRHHVPGPRGAARRAAYRGRGHARDAAAARPRTRSRPADSYHARSDASARRAAGAARGGADLALVTDAGTPGVSATRARARRRVGARAARSCRSPGPRRSSRPSRRRRRRATLVVRGVPAALGRERRERLAGSPPTTGDRPVRGAGRLARRSRPRRGLRPGPTGRRLPRADEAPRVDRRARPWASWRAAADGAILARGRGGRRHRGVEPRPDGLAGAPFRRGAPRGGGCRRALDRRRHAGVTQPSRSRQRPASASGVYGVRR